MECLSQTWGGLSWSPWVQFDQPNMRLLPAMSGVYRVKLVGQEELFYIGQTGRNLRERLGDLIRNVINTPVSMPYNDPHTAAPSLWAWRDAEAMEFACSAAPFLGASEQRKALECYLLWQYRVEKGFSTRCNHGHFHPQYFKSRDRKTGYRGGRLPETTRNPAGGPGIPPLHAHATPEAGDWMGLRWSSLYPLRQDTLASLPASAGIYKVLDKEAEQLLYVGESANVRTRFQDHIGKPWTGFIPMVSFVVLPEVSLAYQRRELENDLIGGYYALYQDAPPFQFRNHQRERISL